MRHVPLVSRRSVLLGALLTPALAVALATPATATARVRSDDDGTPATPQQAVDAGVAHAKRSGVTQYVSVVDRSTGTVLAHTANADQQVASESIMKLFLATYYLVQYGGYRSTPSKLLGRLSYMLRYSDDDTASALFSPHAIPTVAQRYGLSDTANATDRVGHWGAARITAGDMTRFLYRASNDSRVGPWLLPVMADTEPRGSDGFDQDFGLNALTGTHGSKQGWGDDSYWTAQRNGIHSVGYTSRYFVAILQLSASYPDPARATATYTARAIQRSEPAPKHRPKAVPAAHARPRHASPSKTATSPDARFQQNGAPPAPISGRPAIDPDRGSDDLDFVV